VRAYFTEAGYEVVRMKGLGAKSGLAIARMPEAELRRALIELDGDDLDALVQVGTNLPMARIAAEAEASLAKPVLAINTATHWHALRQSGIDDKVQGFGPLLAAH
jgi:maleate isomerase